MKTLEILCYMKDFEAKSTEQQRELLKALLETNVGKDLLHEMALEKLMKQFTRDHKYPTVIALLKASKKAQKRFMEDDWALFGSPYQEVNHLLNVWFESNGHFLDAFVSEDNKMVCLYRDRDPLDARERDYINMVSEILPLTKLVRNKNFDFGAWMKSEDFNSDKIYLMYENLNVKVWWNFYKPGQNL